MAILDMGTAPASTIGNPTTGNYFIFLDNENGDKLTTRDELGVDTVYTSGVIPTELNDLSDVQVTTPLNGQVLKYKTGALAWLNQDEDPDLSNRIVVTQASDFGVIDSTKEYFLDGVIDMGATQITVPSGGINIKGFDFNVSGLTSSENSYTMFTGATAGDVLLFDFKIEVTGTGSKVFDLTNSSGLNAFEISRINFNVCTSLGELEGYRQGLETGTGRFGGTPNLILSGTWLGGYIATTSIVRGLTDAVFCLYEEGTSFTMASRFKTDQNIDLPASACFFDFKPSNFTNPSTVQIVNAIISRDGVFSSLDANITPNMDRGDLSSSWSGNKGIQNTFEGGESIITTEIETTIATVSVFVDLAGTYTAGDLQHFDSPANGQLRHLGDTPIEYTVKVDAIIDGGSNDEVELKIVVWDNSASAFVDYKSTVRVVNNLQGGRDVAFFNFQDHVILDQNDYVKIMVANISNNTNVTAELDSEFIVEQR